MQHAARLGGPPLSDIDCVSPPTSLVHISYFGSLDPAAPAKAAGKAAAAAEGFASSWAPLPTPMPRPARAALNFFYQMLQSRVPTAQVGTSSGGFDCYVGVGCQDDFALATELAAVCGIAPGAAVIRVSNRIEPSALFCLNAVLVTQVMVDPTGYAARVLAAQEVQRCVIGVEIDRIYAPATGLGSGVTESCGSQEVEPPTLIVRVPPPSATLSQLSSLAHAQTVVAHILAKLPHARLQMTVVEGGEEDLMFIPELDGVGISFAKVFKPPHPPDYPLVCDAHLSIDALDSTAAESAASAAGCCGAGAAGDGALAGPSAALSAELVDDKVQSQRASKGHITVGAFGKLGWDLVSTGHGIPASLHKGMLKTAKLEAGVRVNLVAMMNPAQFDGTGAMSYVVCADAEPGAAVANNRPVKQADVCRVVADASLFRCRSFSGPVPADALAPMQQLARWVSVCDSSVLALGLPRWSAYCGEVEIWGVHGKDASGAVRPRLADVVGYSTKMLPERSVDGRMVRASTVVYIAKMRDAVDLVCGDSGGAVTQKLDGAARRLHSLVAARAWHSTDGGVSKTWFVLLVPIHFVVAQIAQLLREQREESARASDEGGGASSDRAPTSIMMGLQLQSSMCSEAELLSEPAPASAGGSGCVSAALPVV